MTRTLTAAALLVSAAPLVAQDNLSADSPPPASAGNIGPRELSNFSLNGTVTRQAQPATAVQPVAPSANEPVARTTAAPQSGRAPSTRTVATEPGASQALGTPGIDPISSRPTLRQRSSSASAAASVPAVSNPVTTTPVPVEPASGFSPLPWIAALLLLAAIAAIFFGRQRQRNRYAAPGVSEFVAPLRVEPEARIPVPTRAPRQGTNEPVTTRPAPRPDPVPAPAGVVTSSLRTTSAPAGTVSSSLRPWIELELEPSQAMVTDEQAAIAFDVTLFNSGSAPARDVAIEACLINAGQEQDVQLSEFYKATGDVRDKIPAVPPMGRIKLKSAVRLPRSAVQEYEVEGRKLFMPMVAVNSRYRWSSGEGQSSASFLVGRAAHESAKLGPLRLDQGERGWKGLAARRYEKGIRR